ncbi:unnamed protein product, partial [Dovyalis caffra]
VSPSLCLDQLTARERVIWANGLIDKRIELFLIFPKPVDVILLEIERGKPSEEGRD